MRISELKTLLVEAIKARMPVMIKGGPGVGKSDAVEQAAHEADADLMISHPAVADPTDAKGLPWANPGATEATFLPFGDLARAVRATKRTVWFLDDFGQATPGVQASFMQLLLARRVGEHVLPDCVTFVAATNRRTDKAAVSGILEPVKSRFGTIVDVDVDADEWRAWAMDHGMPAQLVAFLKFREDLLNKFEATQDLTNSPVPRTWAHVGKLLGLSLPPHVRDLAIAGAVGEGAAAEFIGYLKLWQELPNIDDILTNPKKAKVPTNPAVLYAVVTAVAMKTTGANFPNVTAYAQRLYDESKGEFAALLMRDTTRRDDKLMQTPEFVRIAAGKLGELILAK